MHVGCVALARRHSRPTGISQAAVLPGATGRTLDSRAGRVFDGEKKPGAGYGHVRTSRADWSQQPSRKAPRQTWNRRAGPTGGRIQRIAFEARWLLQIDAAVHGRRLARVEDSIGNSQGRS